jgi:hypothetical protein
LKLAVTDTGPASSSWLTNTPVLLPPGRDKLVT